MEERGEFVPAMADWDKATALAMEAKLRREPYTPISATKALYFVKSAEEKHTTAPCSPPPPRKRDGGPEREERRSIWKRLSGSALCKVTVVVYLLSCVLVSALYVALYGGHSQKMFASSDAWIPGKVRFERKT